VEVKGATNTTIATYTYDHQGRRISKTTSSGTTYYHYDGDSIRLLYETDKNNNVIVEYTWDDNSQPLTMTKNGVTYHYHVNGHGDVTALTDANGNIVAEYEYDAWGNILSQTGSMASEDPLRYAGYYYDEETGLYYLMARYYDAEIGRFLTRDSFHGFEDEPLSINKYLYTKNNPISYVDPNGHWAYFVVKGLQGGISNSWDIVWSFYKKYKFNWRAWKTKFPIRTFAYRFVVGAVLGIVGGGMVKYISRAKELGLTTELFWDVYSSAKAYFITTAQKGEKITIHGLAKAIAPAVLGSFRQIYNKRKLIKR
jgi:RHS repeat-associated protein